MGSSFHCGAGSADDAHRPLGKQHDLPAILAEVEQRVVADDYTLRYGGGDFPDRPGRYSASPPAPFRWCGSKRTATAN